MYVYVYISAYLLRPLEKKVNKRFQIFKVGWLFGFYGISPLQIFKNCSVVPLLFSVQAQRKARISDFQKRKTYSIWKMWWNSQALSTSTREFEFKPK